MLLSLEFIFLISNQLLALSSHSFIADGIALIEKRAYPCDIGFYNVTPPWARGPLPHHQYRPSKYMFIQSQGYIRKNTPI